MTVEVTLWWELGMEDIWQFVSSKGFWKIWWGFSRSEEDTAEYRQKEVAINSALAKYRWTELALLPVLHFSLHDLSAVCSGCQEVNISFQSPVQGNGAFEETSRSLCFIELSVRSVLSLQSLMPVCWTLRRRNKWEETPYQVQIVIPLGRNFWGINNSE